MPGIELSGIGVTDSCLTSMFGIEARFSAGTAEASF